MDWVKDSVSRTRRFPYFPTGGRSLPRLRCPFLCLGPSPNRSFAPMSLHTALPTPLAWSICWTNEATLLRLGGVSKSQAPARTGMALAVLEKTPPKQGNPSRRSPASISANSGCVRIDAGRPSKEGVRIRWCGWPSKPDGAALRSFAGSTPVLFRHFPQHRPFARFQPAGRR